MENIAEFYYNRLATDPNPAKVLTELYFHVTGKNTTKSEIIMYNKLIKIFGKYTAFFSTLDLGKYEEGEITGTPYALLYTICKSRFERQTGNSLIPAFEPLDKLVEQIEEEKEKARKRKVRLLDSSDLGELNGE